MSEQKEYSETAINLMYAPRPPFQSDIERSKFNDALNAFADAIRVEERTKVLRPMLCDQCVQVWVDVPEIDSLTLPRCTACGVEKAPA